MPLPPITAHIVGTHPVLNHNDIRRLLERVLVGHADLQDSLVDARVLSGGFSGSAVLLVIVEEVGSFIVKCGPQESIEREVSNRNGLDGSGEWLVEQGFDSSFGPVQVELGSRTEYWSAMCYAYFGAQTYSEIGLTVDVAEYVRAFVEGGERAPTPDSLRSCFDKVVDWLTRSVEPRDAARGRRFTSFLPPIAWEGGVHSALMIASELCPDLDELRDFRAWYEDESTAVHASVPDQRRIHGDARLANILVHRVNAEVRFIDFGNARRGHLYEDLARFELDLVLNMAERFDDGTLVQDSLADVFAWCLRKDLGLNDLEPGSSQSLKALRHWRQAMSRPPATAAGASGAAAMYRWFLLAECLRRLRWVATNGPDAAGVDAASVLRLICTLRASISTTAEPFAVAAPSAGLRTLHCAAVYVPARGRERSVNKQRNRAKTLALEMAGERLWTVRVLAETGFSYLAHRGALEEPVHDLLARGGRLEIVICNPYFVEAVGISASYGDGRHEPPLDADGLLNTELASRLRSSLTGYAELRSAHPNQIELRFAHFGIAATMLLTEDMYFFEPYLRNDRRRSGGLVFDTFEMQFRSAGTHIRSLLSGTFDFHWRHSEHVHEAAQLEEKWRPILDRVSGLWQSSTPPHPPSLS